MRVTWALADGRHGAQRACTDHRWRHGQPEARKGDRVILPPREPTIMNLLASCWMRLRRGVVLPRIAEEAARATLGLVRQRVWAKAAAMPLCEARGYIRVRAANVVAHELNRLLPQHRRWLESHRSRLVHLATQQLVDRLLADLRQGDACHGRSRTAA